MNVEIGIIGGSGLYDMAELTDREEVTLTTPFGEPSGPYVLGTLRGRRVAFLARHGAGHRLMPSELNFRANIFGMKMLGVGSILSASAVGSLREDFEAARHRRARPVLRSHGRPHQHVLRAWPRGARCLRAPALPRALGDRRRERANGWARRCTGAARTCAWKGRSSRPSPSRMRTGSGAWTSSA